MKKRMVIGIGNRNRGDDGAGVAVARGLCALELKGLEILEESGEGASLIECWRGADSVILIDAVRRGDSPGRIHRLDASEITIPSDLFHYSTHAFSVAEAIELSRVLGDLPPELIVYGIEGADFSPGAPISRAVSVSVEKLIMEIGMHFQSTVLPRGSGEIPPT